MMISSSSYPFSTSTLNSGGGHGPESFDDANAVHYEAALIVPFTPDVLYETFSDFSRHAEWNPSVTNVCYIDQVRNVARWTMEESGLRFGWETVPTRLEHNRSIAWHSIKGLQLEVRVDFLRVDEDHTRILIRSRHVVPRQIKMSLDISLDHSSSQRESPRLKEILHCFSAVVEKDMKKQPRKQ